MALRDTFADPSVLDGVKARDFDPAHAFEDGPAGPALRVGGASGSETWQRIDERAARAIAAYVEHAGLDGGSYLFGTTDPFPREPPSHRGPDGA